MSDQWNRGVDRRMDGSARRAKTAIGAGLLSVAISAFVAGCSSSSPAGPEAGLDPGSNDLAPAPTSTSPTFEPGPGPGGLTIDRPSGWWTVSETEDLLILVGPDVTSSEHFDGDDAMFMASCGLANVGASPAAAIDAFVESAAVEGFELVEGPGPGVLGALDPAETLVATLEYDGGDGAGNLISPALRMLVAAAPGPGVGSVPDPNTGTGNGGQACFVMGRGEQATWDSLGPVYERMMESVRVAD